VDLLEDELRPKFKDQWIDPFLVATSGSILEIVNGQPVSAYNAEYAFVASKLGIRLVTTDKPLLEIAIHPERFL
jgi:predicted nucleic acid-binding protein